MEGHNFQTYMITPLDLNNVQLRSGRVLENNLPSVVIQESEKENIYEKEKSLNQEEKSQKQTTPVRSDDILINSTPIIEQPSIFVQTPPFPKRLKIDKGVEKEIALPNCDMIDKLNNVSIKIAL